MKPRRVSNPEFSGLGLTTGFCSYYKPWGISLGDFLGGFSLGDFNHKKGGNMGLTIKNGEIADLNATTVDSPKEPRLSAGLAVGNYCFLTSENDGDFSDYISSMREVDGLKTATIDKRFYVLNRLKNLMKGNFSIANLKRVLNTLPPTTRNDVLQSVRSYAKFRAPNDPSLLFVLMMDPELRSQNMRRQK
jgi:hypothetical protein